MYVVCVEHLASLPAAAGTTLQLTSAEGDQQLHANQHLPDTADTVGCRALKLSKLRPQLPPLYAAAAAAAAQALGSWHVRAQYWLLVFVVCVGHQATLPTIAGSSLAADYPWK